MYVSLSDVSQLPCMEKKTKTLNYNTERLLFILIWELLVYVNTALSLQINLLTHSIGIRIVHKVQRGCISEIF